MSLLRSITCALLMSIGLLFAWSAASQSVPVSLILNAPVDVSAAGVVAALEAGAYRQSGIHLTVLAARDSAEAIDRVVSNSFAIGRADARALIAARVRGAPIRVIGDVSDYSPIGIVSLAARSSQPLTNLSGRVIGVAASAADSLNDLLTRFQRTPAQPKRVVQNADFGTLERGEIECLIVHLLSETPRMHALGTNVVLALQYSPSVARHWQAYFTTESTLRLHRPLIERFIALTHQGWMRLAEEPDLVASAALLRQPNVTGQREQLRTAVGLATRLISDIFADRPSPALPIPNLFYWAIELRHFNVSRGDGPVLPWYELVDPLIYSTEPQGTASRQPQPWYPKHAAEACLQGTVHLRVVTDAKGMPSEVRTENSSGSSFLDDWAAQWVQTVWTWPSGPIQTYRAPIEFRLVDAKHRTPGARREFPRGGGKFPEPNYPWKAFQRGEEGRFTLYVIVGSNGTPLLVHARKKARSYEIVTTTIRHIERRWRWDPGLLRSAFVPFEFDLR